MADTDNLLSPEELEALTMGIEDGSIETDTGLNISALAIKHDITNEDRSLSMNLTAINLINERFVREFRVGVLDVLRTTTKMTTAKAEIMAIQDYMKTLEAPLALSSINLHPLRGLSMVCIEPDIIFACLDNFFSGFGGSKINLQSDRVFTPIETSIINIMTNILFGSLQEAWTPVMSIKCETIASDINPQFIEIAEDNELVIVNRFSLDFGDGVTGNIAIVYPYGMLKPVRELLSSRVQSGEQESDDSWRNHLRSATIDAELEVKVVLGEIDTTLKQLNQAVEGDIIYFRKEDYARLSAGNTPLFDAEIGVQGSQMAVQIVRSLEPED
ncbi:flagellar motor switch protein FliM [Porticoccaceae bacterium]|nr:flagellar motor switch protein FliM [Porticoccaceae bacterium]